MEAYVLLTGGAGYIGSHTAVQMLQAGFNVLVLDNLSNSSLESLKRVEQITGKTLTFVQGDIRDRACLDQLFSRYSVQSVVHFAGLKAVGESVQQPLRYYDNNIAGTINLCEAMVAAGVFKLVFSSSATVYGEPEQMPIHEGMPTGNTTNPYGTSKLMVEQILQDMVKADPRWHVARLRYFNPVGAHQSGLIGEDPNGIPNNLLPYISQVAVGKLEKLSVFGDDYPTKDGTGVRDYIHVVDLANGHLAALNYLDQHTGCHVWNLGTGNGYSVFEMIQAFEQAAGVAVPYQVVQRRSGDIAECWANPEKAARELNWQAQYSLQDMMQDTWRWQKNNPKGYAQ
ncbi:UDP-glucose 4-epimerase GalE [Pseudomonas sp. F1_0610]|uniref:UDP-glucose 4-epimerase GalE n=1 Tax=Pseudomonas sp. F1_0610 TaxID=3114284 RepID=UPI0039C14014